jgi:diadenosine tetraphosphatase ApaH/serine/threonine PP2A family protein phosphatase
MPLIALISDIHGNIDALNAVMADIKSQNVEEIYCLGDVVGYGGAPGECVRTVMENSTGTVMGNHDEMAVLGVIIAPERVAAPLRAAREELSPKEKQWLTELPLRLDVQGVTLVHSSLETPRKWNYIHNEEDARAHFKQQKTRICFVGHTHVPLIARYAASNGVKCSTPGMQIIDLNKRALFVLNVGSVGQPRDDDPRSSYGLFDTEKLLFQIRRVPYDIAKAQARIREAGLPENNALRLEMGC